jgi:hypothetical protein
MANLLGYPVELGALGAVVGIGAAVLTSGGDTRKLAQIGGMTGAGIGLGMALDPEGSDAETLAGGLIAVGSIIAAVFIGNGGSSS